MATREFFEEAKEVIEEAGFDIDEVRSFMDRLRDSGIVNMYGSGEYLQRSFGFTRFDVKPIILDYVNHGLEVE